MRQTKRLITLIAILTVVFAALPNVVLAETKTIVPPPGLGTLHTYTVWDKIRWGSGCKTLKNFAETNGALSNNHGIVTYGSYFCGALTTTYGKVGDMMLVVQEGDKAGDVLIEVIRLKVKLIK